MVLDQRCPLRMFDNCDSDCMWFDNGDCVVMSIKESLYFLTDCIDDSGRFAVIAHNEGTIGIDGGRITTFCVNE